MLQQLEVDENIRYHILYSYEGGYNNEEISEKGCSDEKVKCEIFI